MWTDQGLVEVEPPPLTFDQRVDEDYKRKHGFCEHNVRRYYCGECWGAGICEHNQQRNKYWKCGGAGMPQCEL